MDEAYLDEDRRVQNPYQNRKVIINPDDFFGRKGELNEIFTLISIPDSPQSISIVGERKIGKSSLLCFIKSEITKQNYLENPDDYMFVYLELSAYQDYDSEQFFEILVRELSFVASEKISGFLNMHHEMFEEFVKLLSSKGKRIIFMFDEFDKILKIPAFTSNLLEYFRSLTNQYLLSFITCSRVPINELTEAGKGSPFFNIFHNFNLGYFEEEEALELIQIPSSKHNVEFNTEDMSFINKVEFRHPFFIQVACSHIFKLRKERNKLDGERIDMKLYDLLFQRLYNDTKAHWSFYLEHMSEEEKNVILKISKGESLSHSEDISAFQLFNKSLVYKNEKWKIFSTLFQRFMNVEESENSKKTQIKDIFTWALAIMSLVVALLGITSFAMVAMKNPPKLIMDLIGSFLPDFLHDSTSLGVCSLLVGFCSLLVSVLSFRLSYISLRIQQKSSHK